MEFLSKIQDVFTVPTRGCVVVPIGSSDLRLRVHPGDAIQLRGANGSVDARVTQIEWIKQESGPGRVGFLLSKEIIKSQIPDQGEIWIESSK
jgi:translation elongation factor EF-Tu-like GTPase